jgi:VWFA-related protein
MTVEAFIGPTGDGGGADGRLIALVLDNLNTPPELGARIRRIATMFVDRMQAGDALSVITLSGGRSFTTGNQQQLRAQIERFRPNFGDTVHSPGQIATSGLEAIRDLSAQLATAEHRRKALVFIGNAALFSPADPSAFDDRGAQLSGRWFEAVRETARNNVSVYAIDPVGFTGSVNSYVEGFAEETGGWAYSNASNFGKAVDEVWRDTGTYYLLGYAAPVNDHRLHEIEVKVRTPNVTVRARRGRG